MATPTDSSFGAGFDAAAFRSAVTSAMEMGLAADVSQRATFRFPESKTYDVADSAGHPWDWSEDAASTSPETDVQIPVAVEFEARPASSLDTALGQFDSPRGIVTVLDTYYPQVKDASLMVFENAVYTIEYWLPAVGLFDVTIYQAVITAQESA